MEVEQRLARWQAVERTVRARLAAVGVARRAQVAGRSGMEVLEAVSKAYTTLELKVNIVRALTEAVPLVRAEGRLLHAGGRVATAEGRLVGPDGELYAHATTTCLVFEQPSPVHRATLRSAEAEA